MLKNAVGEPFSLSIISGIEEVSVRVCGGGGECPDFPSKFSCLTVPKHFAEDPLCAVFQKTSGIEKFWIRGGGGGVSRFSVENFLSHSAERYRRGTF